MEKALHLRNILIVVAALVVSLVSPYFVQQVEAHHCVGHAGSQTAEIATCLDAGACLQTDGSVNCPSQDSAEGTVNRIIATVINVISTLIGIVAVFMIIFAGFKYITSGGDSSNVASAKTTIIYAIVGLIIVAMAQLIVRFVLTKATT